MNAFANTLFSLLLSWVKALAQAVWSLFSGGGAGGFLTWLGDHWLPLVVFLCLCGVAVDMLIWLLRWRPDLVWRTRWRHLMARLRGYEMRDREQRNFYQGYQDGVDMRPVNEAYPQDVWEENDQAAYAPEQVNWWEYAEQAPQAEPVQESYYMPVQEERVYAQRQDGAPVRRRRSEKYQKTERVDPIARIKEKLMEPSRSDDGMIDGLPPIVDKDQAFHAPVYPTQEYTKK